ncbi:hypothetical protein A79_0902 [Vibrio parahaemolyticus AQ3810]|uniref:hypothetical protein n=1 Tax=Vibrio parahaemolyticus TaxID=670 RepID=UPI0001564B17|nr:hypothetical protein [Vibrio parahaemolyticus]EDM61162.1 hypothetical protein A79_0902 [Vibrio parahaemolyticus AQ3810]EJG1927642.1 hypothetical protein [Vibrio parahaemolyticus]EXF66583.1 PLD-like domain protein [Vibrio parahaemolyticus AQ3810]
MNKTNLNDFFEDRDNDKNSDEGVSVSFADNEKFLCSKLKGSKAVVGCAPWFSNRNIIKALSESEYGVSIVLDKSTMPRFDNGNLKKNIKSNQITVYSKNCAPENFLFTPLPFLHSSVNFEFFFGKKDDVSENYDSFRVIGRDQSSEGYKTLFHYKFLVICDVKIKNEFLELIPVSVLCGSFNFTENSTYCREALLHIETKNVVQGFFDEWSRVYIRSENIENYGSELSPEFLHVNSEGELKSLPKDEECELNRQIDNNKLEEDGF